ncbi:MAG: hypothetical protein IKC68_03460 [Bacteroidales bacterium]|nr:hypothetical protein [Bacteroidales bacterium]
MYDKYHISVRNIIRKYKKYLQTEISESNTIISAILNDEISESEYLEILHDAINENGLSWRLYRRSLSDLEFGITDEEQARLVEELEKVEFID